MCPNHLEDESFKAAIKQNGLQQCPRCYVAVEKKAGCNNITYVVGSVRDHDDVLTKKHRCTCGVKFCYLCGISKKTERDRCKCSYPNMQHEEPIEDPVSGEEEVATNAQHAVRAYNAVEHRPNMPERRPEGRRLFLMAQSQRHRAVRTARALEQEE